MVHKSTDFLLRAASLIIGIGVIILLITDVIDEKSALVMLAIGMSCIGYSLIDEATGTKSKHWYSIFGKK